MRKSLGMGLFALMGLSACNSPTPARDAGTTGGNDAASSCPDLGRAYTLAAGTGTACTFAEGDTITLHQSGCDVYADLPGGLSSNNATISAAGFFTVTWTPNGGSTIGLNVTRLASGGLQFQEQSLDGSSTLCAYDSN